MTVVMFNYEVSCSNRRCNVVATVDSLVCFTVFAYQREIIFDSTLILVHFY